MTLHKLRLILMIAMSGLAFLAAGLALAVNAAAPQAWAMPAFTAAIALGVASQVWFIVASLKSMKA